MFDLLKLTDGVSVGSGAVSFALSIFFLVCFVVFFTKANKPGWAAIIPFYNFYCLTDIAMGSGWFFLFMFIPGVNAIYLVILLFKLAKSFGKSTLFAILTIFFSYVCIPIIAFGKSNYQEQ